MLAKIFFITNFLFVVMITLCKTKKVSFYYLMPIPNRIIKIIFDFESNFNSELNSLPNFIEHIELPYHYNKKILNIYPNLKKISCSRYYKFLDDFTNTYIDVEFI